MNKVIAFVHAKGTSNRVPGKNLKTLGDVPLFVHAIRNAKNANLVDIVVIDSDSDEILNIGDQYGAIALKRPEKLATNIATGDDLAYWQASNYPDSEIILQAIPTAPFLKPESIDKAIKMIQNDNVDSVVGVYSEVFYSWKNGKPNYYIGDKIPNSNEMEALVYETTGLYVNKTKAVLTSKKRMNTESCKPILLSKIESVDINTPEDFQFAQILWRGYNTVV